METGRSLQHIQSFAGSMLVGAAAVIVLAAGTVGSFTHCTLSFVLPVANDYRVSILPDGAGGSYPLGFEVGIRDLAIVYPAAQDSPRTCRAAPCRVDAAIVFRSPGQSSEPRPLRPGRPASYGGWTFHLTDYQDGMPAHVTLAARRNPAFGWVRIGLWSALAGVVLLCWRRRVLRSIALATAVATAVAAFLLIGPRSAARPPILQSPWFVPHVASYMVAYLFAATAAVLVLFAFAQRRSAPGRARAWMDTAGRATEAAFPLMTLGLVSGALWAEEAWLAWWSWDPKETWALITWTLYGAALVCRSSGRLRGAFAVLEVAAFLALLSTALLVNLVPAMASPLHSY